MVGKWNKYLFVTPVLIFILLSVIYIYTPGINSDELLFGNAAVGLVNDDTHLYIRFGDFPILLMPYIGALKSYLYYPVFKIFGVSVLSIRLPMILLSGVTVFVVYRIMLIAYKSYSVAFFAALFLATHASFITYSRTDQGPLVIEMFLKALAMLLFLLFIERKKTGYLVWLPLVMFLGVFNKMNFIWTLNAFIAGTIFFLKDVIQIYSNGTRREKIRVVVFPILTVLVSISYYLYLSSHITMLKSYFPDKITMNYVSDRLYSVFVLLRDNFRGATFLSYKYDQHLIFHKLSFARYLPSTGVYQLTRLNFVICGSIILLAFFICSFLFLFRKDWSKKYLLFFTSMVLIILAQVLLVTNATAGWHLFTVYPMLALSLIASLVFFVRNKMIRIILFTLLIGANLNDYAVNLSAYEHLRPVNVWSPKILDLIDYARKQNTKFYQITWGVDDQLITFTRQKDKYFRAYEYGDEMFLGQDKFTNSAEARKHIFDYYIKGKYEDGLYIVSWQRNVWFNNFHIFDDALNENGLTYEIVKNFKDKDTVVYSILKVRKKDI